MPKRLRFYLMIGLLTAIVPSPYFVSAISVSDRARKQPMGMQQVKVALTVFFVAPYVVSARPVLACPSGMVHAKVDHESSRCCYDITCLPGFEPEVCPKDNPTSNCIACRNGTFQPTSSKLSHPEWMKCRHKTNCDVMGSRYRNFGNASRDSTCECIPGFFCDNKQCLPKSRCPVGYGRDTKTGECLPCALGETYSNVVDVSEPCKKVTKCETLKMCTLKPASVQHDSVCANITTTGCGDVTGKDTSTIPKTEDKKVTVKVTVVQNSTTPLFEDNGNQPMDADFGSVTPIHERSGNGDNGHRTTHILVGSGLGIILLIIIAAVSRPVYQTLRNREHKRLAVGAIKRLDQRYSDAANHEADFEIFKDALERTSAWYARLGVELLGANGMREIEASKQDKGYSGKDMVHEILHEWKELKGLEVAAMLPDLYSALKRTKMYETICMIDDSIRLTGSNQSNDSSQPLMGEESNVGSHCDPSSMDVN